MENKLMYVYYGYLRDRYPLDMYALKQLKWCDGTIQSYLEKKWLTENEITKDRVFNLMKKKN